MNLKYNEAAHRTELNVHDYAFCSPAGRRNLFRIHRLLSRTSGYSSHLHLPNDEPHLLDLQFYFSKDIDSLQARVVDVKVALEALSSPVETNFTMRVKDDFCEWNAQTFEVRLGEKVEVTGADSSPDLTLDVRALPLLLSGSLTVAGALRAGLLEGDVGAARGLTSLAGERTSFMPLSDYF